MRALRLTLHIHSALLSLALVQSALAGSITDATGRNIEIPNRIERVMPAGAPAAVLLYTLAPDKMIGWTHTPGDLAKPFPEPAIVTRPELPALMRDGKVQSDEIRGLKPDLILDYGSTGSRYAERARKLQDETGVPVLLFDGKLELTPETYRRLGTVLGAEARAGELAEAAQRLLDLPHNLPSSAAPLRVYYARSADGLVSATSASTLADVIRVIGAANVADVTGKSDGLVRVSRDQITGWNPDAIVSNSPEFWKSRQSPEWSALPAVAKGRVYLAPALPWGWIDEPPSVNRLLGPIWAAHALSGTGTAQDLQAEAVRFYRQFYRTDITQKQFEELMR